MATYAPINYAPPQGTAGAPQMIAAPTYQQPQLLAFGGNAQYTEAGANLANQLLQAYMKKLELDKAEAAGDELSQFMGMAQQYQGPSADPEQAFRYLDQDEKLQNLTSALIGSEYTPNQQLGQEMLLQALLKEPKEPTREEQIGEVLAQTPNTIMTPSFGPLADPEQYSAALEQGAWKRRRTPFEQMEVDEAAVRAAGLGDLDLARKRAEMEMSDEYAQIKEQREEIRTRSKEDRQLAAKIAEEGRAHILYNQRAESDLGRNKRLKEYEQNLESTAYDPKLEQDIRKEFTTNSQRFRLTQEAWDKIQITELTAAGDMALIFNYMKMLDPNSSVMEGEYSNAQNAASWSETIRAKYNAAVNGQILDEGPRENFKKQAKAIYNAGRIAQKEMRETYTKIAEKHNLNVDTTLVKFMRDIDEPEKSDEKTETPELSTELPQVGQDVDVSVESRTNPLKKGVVYSNPEDGLAYIRGDDSTGGAMKLFTGTTMINGISVKYERGEKVE